MSCECVPVVQNLCLYQYSTKRVTFSVNTDLDLTGYSGIYQIKEARGGTLYHTGNSPTGVIITVDNSDPLNVISKVQLVIDGHDIAGFGFKTGVYDLFIKSPGGESHLIASGDIDVNESVTTVP